MKRRLRFLVLLFTLQLLSIGTPSLGHGEKLAHGRVRSRKDTCWSRTENRGSHGRVGKRSFLARALRHQAALQRTCAGKGRLWSEEEMEEGDLASCQYVVHVCDFGLGNRLLTLVSSFLYAMLTNRTFLITDSALQALLCEPFADSSWVLPEGVADKVRKESKEAPPAWELVQQEMGETDITAQNEDNQAFNVSTRNGDIREGLPAGGEGGEGNPVSQDFADNGTKLKMATAYLRWDMQEADQKFFCGPEQEALERATWLVIEADQYFLPGLFLLPDFQQRLELLFPDRDPFSQLANVLVHPSNVVWERITRLEATYFRDASQRVGIQVRTFADSTEDGPANPRILECVVNVSKVLSSPLPSATLEKLLDIPKTTTDGLQRNTTEAAADTKVSEWENELREEEIRNELGDSELKAVHAILDKELATAPITAVLVTSLHSGHFDYLRNVFADGMLEDGTLVRPISLSDSETEVHRVRQDMQALSEMWLLSRSNHLFISGFSTFGYVAAGLGKIRPWLMNNRMGGVMLDNYTSNGRPVCYAAHSREPCFHFFPHKDICKGNGTVDFAKSFKYLRSCRDFPPGVQLVLESEPQE